MSGSNLGILYAKGRWWRVQKNGWKTALKSVSAQAKGNGREVEAFLREKGHPCRVPSVLVFVGTERLDIAELKMPAMRGQEIAAYVAGLPPRLAREEIEQMARLLSPAP